MRKKHFTTIYEKVHRIEFCWVHAKNSQEFIDLLATKISNVRDIITASEGTDGETVSLNINGMNIIFFWFNPSEPTAIVHELLHAVIAGLKDRGINLAEESEETYCYLLSFLYGEVLEVLKKECIKKKGVK